MKTIVKFQKYCNDLEVINTPHRVRFNVETTSILTHLNIITNYTL